MKFSHPAMHLVFGQTAAGKTTYARHLADQLGAVLLDSDEVAERLARAGRLGSRRPGLARLQVRLPRRGL